MITLTAHRQKESWNRYSTILKKQDGSIKAIFPSKYNQPRKGTKTIIINCNKYNLIWSI